VASRRARNCKQCFQIAISNRGNLTSITSGKPMGQTTKDGVQGSLKVDWVERDPSPTALRFPLSPRERAGILIFIPLQGERGDRKAVGEGSTRGRYIRTFGDMRHPGL
jgi:hypothetical protein